jgi:hypothetical protein
MNFGKNRSKSVSGNGAKQLGEFIIESGGNKPAEKWPSIFASILAPPKCDQISEKSKLHDRRRGLSADPKTVVFVSPEIVLPPGFNGFSTTNTRCPPNEICALIPLRFLMARCRKICFPTKEKASGN